MATFYALTEAQITALLNSSGLIAGSVYYATDSGKKYLATTNRDNTVGLADTGLIMTGKLELGFDGAVGAQGEPGPTGATGATGPQGPAGAGGVKNVVTATANYTTATSDDVILANSSSPMTISITTSGLDNKITTVKSIGTGTVTVQGVTGTIDGQASVDCSLQETSIDLLFDGANFWIQ
jgi:hypothetical protein